RQNAPGQFDYYVLSLSWSPSFCETATGNARRQQCGTRPFSFVVHGLWPQYERGFPESCLAPPPRLGGFNAVAKEELWKRWRCCIRSSTEWLGNSMNGRARLWASKPEPNEI